MRKLNRKLCTALLAVTVLGMTACGESAGSGAAGDKEPTATDAPTPSTALTESPKPTATPTPDPLEEGLKAHYELKEVGADRTIADSSGSGYDGKIYYYSGEKQTAENEAVFLSDGAYIELPAEIFEQEDTLTVSIWLKSYSGSVNTSALYFGTTESMPLNYWLLNPANPSGKLKSVLTDADDAGAPYSTEIGISPSVGSKGIPGPVTDMSWSHYVTVITPTELTVYYNGELVGTVTHTKTVSDFGTELAAYIGRSSYNDVTYSGFCRDLRVYHRVLSAEEVKMVFESLTFEKAQTSAVETEIFIADRADPYITKGSDGYYYFTASYPMYGGGDRDGYDRIILRRSETIEGLADAEEIVIWDEKEDETASRYIWAPELHEIDGRWYVLFAASNEKNNVWAIKCHMLACEGDDPYTGTWVNKGVCQGMDGDRIVPFAGFSLDMTYFECNGMHYVAWAQSVGNSNVYLATVNPEEPWKLTSHAMLLTKPEYYWEKVSIPVNEGPAVMIENGKVYLAFSASATGPEYCIGLMYADAAANLMSPASWTKLDYPLLTSDDLIGEYGPGHNSFVQDENGDWIFVYHSRSEECYTGACGYGNQDPLYDPCRSARIRRVKWDENSMPILNQ